MTFYRTLGGKESGPAALIIPHNSVGLYCTLRAGFGPSLCNGRRVLLPRLASFRGSSSYSKISTIITDPQPSIGLAQREDQTNKSSAQRRGQEREGGRILQYYKILDYNRREGGKQSTRALCCGGESKLLLGSLYNPLPLLSKGCGPTSV